MAQPIRLVPQTAQAIEFSCPLCGSVHAAYVFGTNDLRIYRCGGCGLTFSSAQTNDGSPAAAPNPEQHHPDRDERQHASLLEALTSEAISGRVMLVADPDDELVALVGRHGIAVSRVVTHDDLGAGDWNETFSAAIVSRALMRVPDPRAALAKIRRHMSAGARLFLSLPFLDGHQAALMGRNWHQWQTSNRWYFTRETVNLLLLAADFEHVWFEPERRRYSLDLLVERVRQSSEAPSWLAGLETVHRLSPRRLRSREFRLPSGTAVVTATAAPARAQTVVSIIVPVYNERATVDEMMRGLMAKQLPGMRKEIIIVESNSTDGSRELVRSYEEHPDVKLLLQPAPRGKGHAVREGLRAASGDIVMIQDADLEYDFDDYDGLLAPLEHWQSMFVLGSRHHGGWKMRQFTDDPVAAVAMNFGHALFRSLINFALRTSIADPFTMFKVFRRDALHGLEFVCNRFDFDIELLMKLVRKGYVPLELPVNYASRSFAEGKKVSVTRDGLTWIWTILRTRFSPIRRRTSDGGR
jgi:Glycosyl transferase family 2/Methyltransferase domain